MDELAIAFAIRCDEAGLTLEEGILAAENLCDEIWTVAEDRNV